MDLGKSVDVMDANCKGLHHHTVFEREVVGEPVRKVSGDAAVAAKSAIIHYTEELW